MANHPSEAGEFRTRTCTLIHGQRDPSAIVRSFFKVMIGEHFFKVLYFPPRFARLVSHLNNQETELEDATGQRWRVGICNYNGSLAIRQGWRTFSSEHGLKMGDFLVFHYIPGQHFVVQIYDTSCCDKINFYNGTRSEKKRPRTNSTATSHDELSPGTERNLRKNWNSTPSVTPVPVSERAGHRPVTTTFASNIDADIGERPIVPQDHMGLISSTSLKSAENGVNDYASISKFKEKEVTSDVWLTYPFEGYNIFGEGPTQLMSSFSEWIQKGLYKKHAQKSVRDDHYKVNCSKLGFEQLDFVVAFPTTKNWFYVMSQPNKCWNDAHVDVIFYYLRKKSKQSNSSYRYTTANCFFKTFIDKVDVVDYEKIILNIIKGFSIAAGLPWHLTDEVYIPVNCDDQFHWVLAVIVLKERCLKVYDSMYSSKNRKMQHEIQKLATMLPKYLKKSHFFEQKDLTDWSALQCYKGNKKSDPFEVKYITGIAQQERNSLDCGLFVAAYAEFLSDGLQVPSSGIVAESLRLRYASLLWNYGFIKAQNGYVSD